VTATIYVERDGVEVEVEVEGTVHVDRGVAPSMRDPGEPPSVDIDIESVTVGGKPFDLTPDEESKADDALFAAWQESGNGED
jgi:hypothetical protein